MDFSSGASIFFWIMPLSDGTLFSKDNLHFYITSSSLVVNILTYTASATLPATTFTSNCHLGQWTLVSLDIREGNDILVFALRIKKETSNSVTIPDSEWTDSMVNFEMGNNLTGFIYYVQVYDDHISSIEFDADIFHIDDIGCYYPVFDTGCISTETDPSKNKNSLDCSCSPSVSCWDDQNECIESSSDCIYAETSYPHNCLDPSSFCGSDQYLPSVRKCNFNCIDYCDDCTSSTSLCDICIPGFEFISGICACPSGFFYNSGSCEACIAGCDICSDNLSCSTCKDGYYMNGSNCAACDFPCETCTTSPDNCLTCLRAYYPDSNLCLRCSSGCLLCNDSSDCTECSDGFYLENQQCNTCSPICKTCNSNTACTSCYPTYYLSNQMCIICPRQCIECTDAFTCIDCSDSNASLISGACVCNEGYEEREGKCLEVVENCEVYNDDDCTICQNQFFLDTYGDCFECGEGCEECTGSYSCTRCRDSNAQIDGGSCVCSKTGSFMIDGICHCENGITILDGEDWECAEDLTEEEQQKGDTQQEENQQEQRGETEKQNEGTGELEVEEVTIKEIKSVVYSVSTSIAVSFINMITMDDPTALWTLLNTYQFISYLPLLSVDFPQDVSSFLGSFQLARFLPNFFVDRDKGEEAPEKFKEYGAEKDELQNLDSIRNTGRYILILGALLIVGFLLFYLGPLLPMKKIREKCLKERDSWVSSILRLWNSLSLDLAIPSYFPLFLYIKSSFLSTVWAMAIFQINLILLFTILRYTRNKQQIKDKDPNIYRIIGTFLEELSNKSLWSSRYYFILNIRKMLWGLTIFFYHENPTIALVPQILCSFLSVFYFVLGKVFKDKTTTSLYVIGEATLFTTFTCCLLIHRAAEYSSEFGHVIEVVNIGFILLGTLFKLVLSVIVYIKQKYADKNNEKKTHVKQLNLRIDATPDVIFEDSKQVILDNNNFQKSYAAFSQHHLELY